MDALSPRTEPAKSIYEAFMVEAAKRKGRKIGEWTVAEHQAVLLAGIKAAKELGVKLPSPSDVSRAERNARGCIDYGAIWARGLAEIITGKPCL